MSVEGWEARDPGSSTGGNPSQPVDPKAVKIEPKPVVTGLPFGWYVEYAGWAGVDGGMSFVIVRPQIRWSYADFVCLVLNQCGPNAGRGFRQVPILGVTRWRDGGTTEVKTAEGSFLFPTPFDKERKPTFCGEEVTLHDRVQGACG